MTESFPEYRTRVLGYLGSRDPVGVLRVTPGQLARLLTGASRAALTTRPAPGKWSVLEIVGHLADAELALSWRLRNAIAAPGVALAWWDEAVWAERLGYQAISWRVSLGRFKALRLANLALLRSLPLAAWDGSYGTHPTRGRQSVREFVTLEAAHDLNHLRQIRALITPEGQDAA
jgi:DinB superfamily